MRIVSWNLGRRQVACERLWSRLAPDIALVQEISAEEITRRGGVGRDAAGRRFGSAVLARPGLRLTEVSSVKPAGMPASVDLRPSWPGSRRGRRARRHRFAAPHIRLAARALRERLGLPLSAPAGRRPDLPVRGPLQATHPRSGGGPGSGWRLQHLNPVRPTVGRARAAGVRAARRLWPGESAHRRSGRARPSARLPLQRGSVSALRDLAPSRTAGYEASARTTICC